MQEVQIHIGAEDWVPVLKKQIERETVNSVYEPSETDSLLEAQRLRDKADSIERDIETKRRERCVELAVADRQEGNIVWTAERIYDYIYGGVLNGS